MRFEFATANRILFGAGACVEVPGIAASLGKRVFLVTDSSDRSSALFDELSKSGISVYVFIVKKEPDIDVISMATRSAQQLDCQVVIGFGGGSAMDTGKTCAAMLANSGNVIDYMEVVGAGRSLQNPSLPYIAIPTTAGTGSEVTRNAVISVPERRVKASIRSAFMLPRVAIIDPELTYSLPPSVTATTGMDALTQLIEPLVCNSPTPMTDAICRDGIPRIARSFRKAFANGNDVEARQDMSLASLFGGMALANAKLGAVHGLANPIGGVSQASHGAICAKLLPIVMEINLQALREQRPLSPTVERYTETARLLTGHDNASAEEGIIWVNELCRDLGIRPLSEFGLENKDFPGLVEQGQKASSMKGNPIPLTDEQIMTILENAA